MVNRTLLHSLEPSETEWQKELDRAFSGMEASELDEIIAGFGEEEDILPNKIVDGRVVRVDAEMVVIDVGYKCEGTIPVNEQASNWIANGSIGAASFGRQPLIGILGTNHLANRSITLTITGNAVDPLSGPWNFTAVVSVFVSN